jgi:hypothetical protein
MLALLVAGLLATCFATVLYHWRRWQRLRNRASIEDVVTWLGTLLRSFAPGSVVIAESNGGDGFLQFALTQREKEWRTLEFGLPEAEWSRTAITEIQHLLAAAGGRCSLENAPVGQTIERFLRAELSGVRTEVLQKAMSVVPRIAAALGHSAHQTYKVRLLGNEAVDYRAELAEQLENLSRGGRFEKAMAKVVRGHTGHK